MHGSKVLMYLYIATIEMIMIQYCNQYIVAMGNMATYSYSNQWCTNKS